MTTDPTQLQERIERILAEHPILPPTYAGDDPIARKRERTAARIAEEVAAEVRKGQHDAWEKGWEAAIDQAPGDVWFDEWHYQTNPYPEKED